jgi:tRNA dimethylallyltransferase
MKLARAPSERATLHRRIEQRFGTMLERGLVDEVEHLWRRGDLSPDLPSMRCVGYRQVLKYLQGECSWDDMLHRGIVATRQLAKRQITWLRAETDCHWLRDEVDPLAQTLGHFERIMERVSLPGRLAG